MQESASSMGLTQRARVVYTSFGCQDVLSSELKDGREAQRPTPKGFRACISRSHEFKTLKTPRAMKKNVVV